MNTASFFNTVNGESRSGSATYRGIDPATRKYLWDVPVATRQDLDDAVTAAQTAFKSWSVLPFDERKQFGIRFGNLYEENLRFFHELTAKECGRPKIVNEALSGYNMYRYHSVTLELPQHKVEDPDRTIITQYVPMGVVGAICPWNFFIRRTKCITALGKIAPALLAGCCVIVKPSPFTPYSALKLVELAQQVFPPGVLQALGGEESLGPWMTEHPGIHKISFTGSIATGKRVMRACAATLKRVTLELGGNDASIICGDIDIAKVAPLVTNGAFRNSGQQVCTATKRIYVHESIYSDFVKAMVAHATTLTLGDSEMRDDVKLGPVQNQMQYSKVREYFDDCTRNGYTFAIGRSPEDIEGEGYFVQPTIIDNPPAKSRIVVEEPFGPIVPVISWSEEEEVIRAANDTNTGLAGCVWTADAVRGRRIADQLEAGNIFINSAEAVTPKAVFSGHKESGLGSEWGPTSLLNYCNTKVVHIFK
ncbi:uncharacterized protein Z520_10251 [Fonsecaea multimorphosa CBS 102226]|uniref:aldehyde dehydrogenase (NAD(+)) n=1 Tax=Fonsecaea multimorphosa CBS 102226 TaxID=1442371 RepID=A0A0D2JTZ4_9EURO|nr:uncharacterized protein Z520_10251 [Fonsecaea multimorphosa CBS 102226]KIX93914.1 hypothetical protein Z520_10251 [Fonsecaea multimorphosa CBS 102226]